MKWDKSTRGLVTVLALLTMLLALWLLLARTVRASDINGEMQYIAQEELEESIMLLCPKMSATRAEQLAFVFAEQAQKNKLNPKLLLAVAMKESRFSRAVELGLVRGSRGEIGLMQIMPSGLAMRFRPRHCDLTRATCNVATGARYLAHLRARCGGPWPVWVGAYASRSCPTERVARDLPGVQLVAHYLERIAD